MKKMLFLSGALFFLLYSCGSQYPMLAQNASVKSTELQKSCSQQKIKSAEATKADSLYTVGSTLYKKGKHDQAYLILDAAATYYRLALSMQELKNVDGEIEGLKKALSDAEDKLGMYNKVLNELKTMER